MLEAIRSEREKLYDQLNSVSALREAAMIAILQGIGYKIILPSSRKKVKAMIDQAVSEAKTRDRIVQDS